MGSPQQPAASPPGALAGCRVVELVGVGPGPFCGMLLADMGADVVRIERPAGPVVRDPRADVLARNRPSVAVDLKRPAAVELVLDLVSGADALIDPFRPGVTERLGLGPDTCFERNRRLVYGRMTGWGQEGRLAWRAGHDINYLARNGVLGLIGRADGPPVPPINLVGDFGGGAMFLAVGLLAGIISARATGVGQVVDAAMVDGSALLTAMVHQLRALDDWRPERGTNVLDTGAPYYDVYETSDGGFMSVGSMEPQFYEALLEVLGLDSDPVCRERFDRGNWPSIRERFAAAFRSRTRTEWAAAFADVDACVEPVLGLDEALADDYVEEREIYVEHAGVVQPAPAPRFSATPSTIRSRPPLPGEQSVAALAAWGIEHDRIERLVEAGAVVPAEVAPGE
jgi:alpha-methylacyl-CoA racemase